MSFCRLFHRPLAATFALTLLALSAQAQTATRPRQATPAQPTTTTAVQGRSRLENDIFVVDSAAEDEAEPVEEAPRFGVPTAKLGFVERSMLTAIEERLG